MSRTYRAKATGLKRSDERAFVFTPRTEVEKAKESLLDWVEMAIYYASEQDEYDEFDEVTDLLNMRQFVLHASDEVVLALAEELFTFE